MKINDVFFQRVIENNNIIHVNANKIFENAKNVVNFSLNVKKKNFDFHDCYVKLFLFLCETTINL